MAINTVNRDLVYKKLIIALLLTCFSWNDAFAQIEGEIIALDGTRVQVKIVRSEMSMAKPGDAVDFKADLGGVEIKAGTGKVVSHDAGTIIIQVTEGNLGLGMTALIHATGSQKLEAQSSLSGAQPDASVGGSSKKEAENPDESSDGTQLVEGQGTLTSFGGPEWEATNARVTRSWLQTLARDAVRGYLNAMKNIPPKTRSEDVATGEYLERMKRALGDRSLYDYARSAGEVPRSFEIRCYLCNIENQTCQVSAYVELDKELPGQGQDTLFDTQITGTFPDQLHKVSFATINAEDMMAFKSKEPSCEE